MKLTGSCLVSSLGVVAWLACLPACSSSSNPPTDAGQDSGDPDGSDLRDGSDGTDTDPGDLDCLPTGSDCQSAGQCCSGRCEQEVCLGPTGLCFELGHECVASSECCSGRCEADASGHLTCALGGGCLGLDAACQTAIDCCSLACLEDVCSDETLCITVGQACDGDSACCSNDCGDDGNCASSGATCAPLGELCSGSDNSCCSGKCESIDDTWRCVQVSVCRGEGDVCSRDSDCCSGVCGADGLCPVLDECQTAGEPCTGFHECCSGLCADPGTGTTVCMFVSGCRSVGELCRTAEQCCGGLCEPLADTGLSRCVKPVNPGCLNEGEVCGGFSQGTSYNCCPPGANGGAALCLPTVLGVTRCFGPDTADQCLADGQACAFADECCGGFCLPAAESGELVCGAACVPLGATCTTDADCCADAICSDGACEPNPFGCTPIGDPCEQDQDCCSAECLSGHCGVS